MPRTNNCIDCGSETSYQSARCRRCASKRAAEQRFAIKTETPMHDVVNKIGIIQSDIPMPSDDNGRKAKGEMYLMLEALSTKGKDGDSITVWTRCAAYILRYQKILGAKFIVRLVVPVVPHPQDRVKKLHRVWKAGSYDTRKNS